MNTKTKSETVHPSGGWYYRSAQNRLQAPQTARATANAIGFYSCATVQATLCAKMESDREALLKALRDLLADAESEGMAHGPCSGALIEARKAIAKAESHTT